MNDQPKDQRVVVSGILIHRDQVLLLKRGESDSFLSGFFEVPGGKVEWGEDPQAALIREFQEETNLIIEPFVPIRTMSYIHEERNIHYIEIVYLVDLIDDNIDAFQISEDHQDHVWATYEELDKYLDRITAETEVSVRMAFELDAPEDQNEFDQ